MFVINVLFSEPERKLLLAEKGGGELGTEKSCIVTANKNFHFIGTMNPGGDYGKKEVCILCLRTPSVIHINKGTVYECIILYAVCKH
jgi:midasin (ATPase involved in ribosome maturation)